jgi:hypothetical protein
MVELKLLRSNLKNSEIKIMEQTEKIESKSNGSKCGLRQIWRKQKSIPAPFSFHYPLLEQSVEM